MQNLILIALFLLIQFFRFQRRDLIVFVTFFFITAFCILILSEILKKNDDVLETIQPISTFFLQVIKCHLIFYIFNFLIVIPVADSSQVL